MVCDVRYCAMSGTEMHDFGVQEEFLNYFKTELELEVGLRCPCLRVSPCQWLSGSLFVLGLSLSIRHDLSISVSFSVAASQSL